MFAQQLKTALIAVWLIASLGFSAAVIAPFVLPADVIFDLLPACEARAQGRECSFCGMTTSFVMIGHGLLDEAWRANRAGLPLFSVFVWNGCAALWFVLTALSRLVWRRPVRLIVRREETGPPVQAEETSCRS